MIDFLAHGGNADSAETHLSTQQEVPNGQADRGRRKLFEFDLRLGTRSIWCRVSR
jgi:hypothetical protein